MRKIIFMLLIIVASYTGITYASDIDNHSNFRVAKKQLLNDYHDLATFQEGGKKGLKDADGNIIAKAEWDEIHIYVDLSGVMVQQFIPVQKDGFYGIIDRKGNIICEPIWKDANQYSTDAITVMDFNNKYGFIGIDGHVIVEPKYDYVSSFNYDVAQVGRDFGYTYIDKEGNEIMPLQPAKMQASFDNEIFCYELNEKYYLIDKNGNILIDGKYKYMSPYLKDVVFVKLDGKCGIINGKDEIILPIEYDTIFIRNDSPERTDIIYGVTRNGKSGYIDQYGNKIGNIEWDLDFHYDWYEYKNLLLIQKENKYGFMDKEGNIVIESIYNDVSGYVVELNGLIGILNEDGSYLVEPKWTVSINDVHPQDNGYYIVWVTQSDKKHDYKRALIDPKGQVIIEDLFDNIMYSQWGFLASNYSIREDTDYLLLELVDHPIPLNDDFLKVPQNTTQITYLVEKGILKGDENGNLNLYDYVTRAEFVTMILRANEWEAEEGENVFLDIGIHWAKNEIIKAAKEGLLAGFEDGTFKPDDYVTKDQALRILLRAIGLSDETIFAYGASNFKNDCLSLAYEAKIVPDNLRKINNASSRIEIVVMIYKYLHTDMTKETLEALQPEKAIFIYQ